MVDIGPWMEEAVTKLRAAFGERLLCVGLQGSYRRGEATEESDIDILTVLDTLSAEDIAQYRAVLNSLPEGQKACGFTSGKEELRHWPAYEIPGFVQDTQVYHGSLDGLLPAWGEGDVREGIRVGASGLYHTTVHLYAAGEEDLAGGIAGLMKPLYFLLKAAHHLRTGQGIETKAKLEVALTGSERELIRLGNDEAALAARLAEDPRSLYEEVLGVCSGLLINT